MDWIKSLYPEVREILQKAIPHYWPELRQVVGELWEEPLAPEAILPLAACRAVNGEVRNALHVSASIMAAQACLRLFDDISDKDRPGGLWEQAGQARAWNYASAVHMLSFAILGKAPLSPHLFRKLFKLHVDSFLLIATGQDRDMAGVTGTMEDYWLTIKLKTGCAYAAACVSGAMVGTEDDELIKSCHLFGHHLGLAVQILNDMESVWRHDGTADLKHGKITLPLIYGRSFNHPQRDELSSLIQKGIAVHSERIVEILDRIGTKDFLIWSALKEREQALDAIRVCPNAEGREALESYITGMFGDLDILLKK
jgi:geranylgeranyl diphosphate synthase type I